VRQKRAPDSRYGRVWIGMHLRALFFRHGRPHHTRRFALRGKCDKVFNNPTFFMCAAIPVASGELFLGWSSCRVVLVDEHHLPYSLCSPATQTQTSARRELDAFLW